MSETTPAAAAAAPATTEGGAVVPAGAQINNTSLYVGDLDKDVKEDQLFDVFRQAGTVLSIRICRDVVTSKSLGYAYVNFQNPADAERALQTLNYHQVGNKQIRVMFVQRDPALRYSGSGNIFVKNLKKEVDNKGLFDLFSRFGNILSCKVMMDETGESRGYGFVHFDKDKSATEAIHDMNGLQELVVSHFIRRNVRLAAVIANFTNLYIKQVLPSVNQQQIEKFFSKFGGITSTITRTDKRGRVFAFCNFASHDHAVKAIEELHDKPAEGLTNTDEKLYVARAQPKSERLLELRQKFAQRRSAGNNLYVRNFDLTFTTETLRELFGEYGNISSCVVVHDENTVSRGFGFVCFESAEQANHALRELNGRIVGNKPLFVNVAQRRDVRQSMLRMQFQQRFVGPMVQRGVPTLMGGYAPHPGGHPAMLTAPRNRGGFKQPHVGPIMGGYAQAVMRPPAPRNPPAQVVSSSQPQAQQGSTRSFVQSNQPYTAPRSGRPPYQSPSLQAQTPPSTPPLAPITAESLSSMTKEEQKMALGERLFQKIVEVTPTHAPKITGMLLEIDFAEALSLLENEQKLNAKVEEALCVLREHELASK